MIDEFRRVRDALVPELLNYGQLLYSPVLDQVLVQVRDATRLLDLAAFLARERVYLVTVVGNDERELEDRRFKIYYMFSHPTADLFILVEYLLRVGAETYPSLYQHFPAVDPFERELLDMLGLSPHAPREAEVEPGSWLHESFPDRLHPLRRDRTGEDLRRQVAEPPAPRPGTASRPEVAAGDGAMVLPVGPIHAGIIEPGQFLFTIAGEAVEELRIRLGYTHRGIERLLQSQLDLLEGWRLAEQVSGDSSFAHSLAYCKAVETLTDTRAPAAAELFRAVFLELERIHNHVADIAALAEDVARDRHAAELAVVREQLLRLNQRLTGHRYLRRICRPGGLALPAPVDQSDLRGTLHSCLATFRRMVDNLKGRAGFRDRLLGVGLLTRDEALRLGATGLAARASGIPRDSRWDHPDEKSQIQMPPRDQLPSAGRDAAYNREARAGDVHARFLTRVDEVADAHFLIGYLLDLWTTMPAPEREQERNQPEVRPENNYTLAVGYAEGFRGDIVYWLMQDKMDGIYRCKIRDPSMLNWPALRQSVLPRTVQGARIETVLADFPIINKSFSLSYSGNDL